MESLHSVIRNDTSYLYLNNRLIKTAIVYFKILKKDEPSSPNKIKIERIVFYDKCEEKYKEKIMIEGLLNNNKVILYRGKKLNFDSFILMEELKKGESRKEYLFSYLDNEKEQINIKII